MYYIQLTLIWLVPAFLSLADSHVIINEQPHSERPSYPTLPFDDVDPIVNTNKKKKEEIKVSVDTKETKYSMIIIII